MTREHGFATARAGLIWRARARLARVESWPRARGRPQDTARPAGTPIVDLTDRCQATVCGTVRKVSLRPRGNVLTLVVELYDDSHMLRLIWLGRRGIGGVEPGVHLSAHGRVTYQRGIPTIFNPAYEIRPDHGC